ncbi:hypothetical protein Cpin_0484 [Chitinophaga pinensis DSM 2588]|jgi:hypothetical protein|uniref:Uncharacterized protein n=1 Tax=Chitinophaga pinensis (strain ATCC 43595 / DSM 2588 / LMG 13176 / NBRC 15968 / NCIMB 11800 / UQM 2034) TaxID=485918 RepID=A0A979GM79_CHIPD|nr:hypothetical protein Cpin_0484 [Chitinophaga pinensis DSM 2588]
MSLSSETWPLVSPISPVGPFTNEPLTLNDPKVVKGNFRNFAVVILVGFNFLNSFPLETHYLFKVSTYPSDSLSHTIKQDNKCND